MALKMTKRGQADNELTYEFMCDTSADLQNIDPRYITLGSIATVIQGETGFEVYMANSQKEWVNIGGGSGSNNSGSSEPVWVNQDIITSVPETASWEIYGKTCQATNMLLNNHVIQGNIVPFTDDEYPSGYFIANINPSLTTSFIDIYSGTEPEPNQEYYIACISVSPSMYDIQNDTIDTLMVPTAVIPTSAMSATEGLNGDVAFYITNTSDTLYIYKIPGYVVTDLYYGYPLVIHYLFSSLQPEATYDISQLIYETPQAGE